MAITYKFHATDGYGKDAFLGRKVGDGGVSFTPAVLPLGGDVSVNVSICYEEGNCVTAMSNNNVSVSMGTGITSELVG